MTYLGYINTRSKERNKQMEHYYEGEIHRIQTESNCILYIAYMSLYLCMCVYVCMRRDIT